MGGSDVKLLIQKLLYVTDVSRGHNHLSMLLSQIRAEFLTDGEKAVMNTQIGKRCEEIEVRLIDPSLNERTICLKKWVMRKSAENFSSCYVLVKTWNMVVSDNNLQSTNVVQLWSFQVGSELCFALVECGRRGEGSSGTSGKSYGKSDSIYTRKKGEDGDNSSKNGGEGASSSHRSEGQDGASSSKKSGEDASTCPEN
ncbi:hypothetical protein L1049_023053 [Liquidambar formosana]|uniref:B3 domain-containing protein n=1 Tax=Liquidambar formosana TaxID=63359 RepID=A0AAP0WPR2_LIQFO